MIEKEKEEISIFKLIKFWYCIDFYFICKNFWYWYVILIDEFSFFYWMKYILFRKNNKVYLNSVYVFSIFYVLLCVDDFVKKKFYVIIVSLNC